MQYRTLGNSGPDISVIGLGTWAMGGGDWKFGWGDQDENESIATIVKAVELGINWIDTAAIYGEGRSEILVGKALQQISKGDRPHIATKCGRVPLGNGEIGKNLSKASIIAECEGSLQRLNVECIDLYQLHWPEPDEDIEEGWSTILELQRQGKVRHIGVSNHSVSQMKRLQPLAPITSLQPPYSMIARDVEVEILAFCRQNKIGVICYSPMGKGLLTGTFTAERAAQLSETDHRRQDPRFQSPQLEINLQFVGRLKKIAHGLGWTVPELAIAWVLRRPEVTSAIVGARRPGQVIETVVAGTRTLDKASAAAVEEAINHRDGDLAAAGDFEKPRV